MMGERLIIAANEITGVGRTRFCAVRFGNVIGSRGSVVPIFAGQVLRGEPVTITDAAMTRYVMTVDEAGSLVLEAGMRMRGCEVFVTKMRALRITDLAHAIAELLTDGKYDVIHSGLRAGEKLYEELITADERQRTLDLPRLLVVLPTVEHSEASVRGAYPDAKAVEKEWNSSKDTLMRRDEIIAYLSEHKVLEPFTRPGAQLQ